jgi:hypothetical protein
MDIGAYQTQPLSITTASLPGGTSGTPYTPTTITAAEAGFSSFTFSVTSGSLPDGLSLDNSTGKLSGTPTAANSFTFTVTAKDVNGFTAKQTYTVTIAKATPTLSVSAFNFSATAGAPFSGTVATFTTPDTADGSGAFTATILWGDGSSSSGIVKGSGGSFTVSGSHTYADPNSSPGYAVSVQISNPNTKSGTANDTAIVTSLGQTVGKGLAGGIGFWHNQNGQALIHSFGNTTNGQTLANWLATTFPNLYGPSTGSNNLTNKTNDQVAAYYLTLFNLSGPKVQAQVLAMALNIYATTASLGGNASAAYGFSVSAAGLGAYSFNVGSDGAAFGVANNTTRNVSELLLAVNNQASNGILYNGNPMQSTLQGQAGDLFTSLNQAGDIP